jgi:hypothetical protein
MLDAAPIPVHHDEDKRAFAMALSLALTITFPGDLRVAEWIEPVFALGVKKVKEIIESL